MFKSDDYSSHGLSTNVLETLAIKVFHGGSKADLFLESKGFEFLEHVD